MKYKINVLVADDHPMICKGFKQLVEESQIINVIGFANTGAELLQKYFELKPDVVVIDISMPVMDGLHAFNEIIKNDEKVKALFYSVCGSKYEIFKIYDAGAKGYISKNKDSVEIIKAIKTVFAGKLYFDDNFTEHDYLRFTESFQHNGKKPEDKILSKRESDVLVLVSQGLTNKKIASQLNISEKTVEVHRRNIRVKFGLVGSAELVKYAIKKIDSLVNG